MTRPTVDASFRPDEDGNLLTFNVLIKVFATYLSDYSRRSGELVQALGVMATLKSLIKGDLPPQEEGHLFVQIVMAMSVYSIFCSEQKDRFEEFVFVFKPLVENIHQILAEYVKTHPDDPINEAPIDELISTWKTTLEAFNFSDTNMEVQ